MKTIAIDFDAVIHKYSKGWQDGSIYDEPVPGAIRAINSLLGQGYSVFVFSTRWPWQIKSWLKDQSNQLIYYTMSEFHDRVYTLTEWDAKYVADEYENQDRLQYKVRVIPFWKKFWNEKQVLGITRRKLVASVYIDDRALKFDGDWDATIGDLVHFKTYQEIFALTAAQ